MKNDTCEIIGYVDSVHTDGVSPSLQPPQHEGTVFEAVVQEFTEQTAATAVMGTHRFTTESKEDSD